MKFSDYKQKWDEFWGKSKKEEEAEYRKTNTKKVWAAAGITAIISFLLLAFGCTDMAIIIFGLLFIWTGLTLKEIKEPEIGFLFQMGDFKGYLEPGWHLGLPFFWAIETRTSATQEIPFKEEMYTKSKKAIILRGGIYYKLDDYEKSINLPEGIVQSRIKNVVFTRLKWFIGQKEFKELLDQRGNIEKEVKNGANDKEELGMDGYKVTGVEIADLEEMIESEAAKKKEIGGAEAWVDGEKAKAVAEPLKDNYPAAIAMAASTIGDKVIGKILGTKTGKKEKEGGGDK